MLVDSHCHLSYDEFAKFIASRGVAAEDEFYSVKSILDRAKEKDVKYVVNIGTCISEFEKLKKISDEFQEVFMAVGIHPDNTHAHLTAFSEKEMHEVFHKYCTLPKTVAIGEIGLDFHINHNIEEQKKLFNIQLEYAEEFNLPISIHSRNAEDEIVSVLRKHPNIRGVIHCFSGESEFTEQILQMQSYYFGIGGTLTFKNNKTLQAALQIIPLERILLETDAPFLAPTPFRGKINEPSFIIKIVEKIAEIKNISIAEVADTTTNNFFNLFRKAKT